MLIDNATRPTTKKKYKSIDNNWVSYCRKANIDPFNQETDVFLNFLATNYERKLRWGTLRTYVPALRPYLRKVDVYQVRQLLRGIFNLRPPVAKYTSIWDVNILLAYLSVFLVENMKDRVMKLATLLMLLSGNRVNMLTHMKMQNIFLTEMECTFVFDEVLKHSRPGFNTKPMVFRAFPDQPSLCPVKAICEYLEARNAISDDASFFVTHRRPYSRPSPDTIARWIKGMLVLSGIESGKYSAHSCRHAATSSAMFRGIGLETILKSASWSNAKTFKKHYFREISQLYNLEIDTNNFGKQTLENYVDK